MAIIEIIGWKEKFIGFTGWDAHFRSELKKRLRRGIKASPEEINRLARKIVARDTVCLSNVYDEGVFGITQLLQSAGADILVTLDNSNSDRLFRFNPRRIIDAK